jgi:hypothetical protein
MKGNGGYWGGGISIISQNFPKSSLILFHPLESSISQTNPYDISLELSALQQFPFSNHTTEFFQFFFTRLKRVVKAGSTVAVAAAAARYSLVLF